MARPLRIEAPDAVYHVRVHAIAGDVIVRDDWDRGSFLQLLAHVVDRYSLVVHAYSLLDDGYHLLVGTPLANLGQAMQRLNGLHARYVNQRHDRWGHLFGGRYQAALVECGPDFVSAARRIDLSPVAAGLCRRPADYPWSSYAATIGLVEPPRFLVTDDLLRELDADLRSARAAYGDYVAAGLRRIALAREAVLQVAG